MLDAVPSTEKVGDIGLGSSTEGIGDAPVSVIASDALLSIRSWNGSFGPLLESMCRRMEGVKGRNPSRPTWAWFVIYRFYGASK